MTPRPRSIAPTGRLSIPTLRSIIPTGHLSVPTLRSIFVRLFYRVDGFCRKKAVDFSRLAVLNGIIISKMRGVCIEYFGTIFIVL